MEIKKIKKLENNKYKVTFENKEKMVTYDDVILKNGLLFNKEIDANLLNTLNIETKYYDIYYKVIRYIVTRLRSKYEIEKYLEKQMVTDVEKEMIVDKLFQIGLIDDKKFAKAYIADKIYLSNIGPLKISEELVKHEIDENIIIEEINKIDDKIVEDKINKIVDKKIRLNKKHSFYMLKQKIYMDLLMLGYDATMIKNIINSMKDTGSVLEGEYTKIYNKLRLKYENDKLYFEIRKKLYSKGFSLLEIDNLIEEQKNKFI